MKNLCLTLLQNYIKRGAPLVLYTKVDDFTDIGSQIRTMLNYLIILLCLIIPHDEAFLFHFHVIYNSTCAPIFTLPFSYALMACICKSN